MICDPSSASNNGKFSPENTYSIFSHKLFSDSVDAVERAFELGQQFGKRAYRRDLASWSKRKKRKINRLDLLRKCTVLYHLDFIN